MNRSWWAFVSKAQARATGGAEELTKLGTQLFVYEWAGIYATGYPKNYSGLSGQEAAEKWIDDIADDMHKVMIYA